MTGTGGDGIEGYEDLLHGMAAVELPRDFVRVSGPEAASYLQGQLSQDVLALGPGDSALALLLEPQGKIDAFLRVSRVGEDNFVLDLDAGFGPAAVARLGRFKLRTKVDIELLDGWRCVAVRGPAADGAGGAPGGGGEVSAVFDWPGLGGHDLLGRAPEPPPGVPVATLAAYEARRIECGLPAMGAELDERTIPEEAGLVGGAVSFTKGCYTGQELVARIESRGSNVPRRLRGLVATTPGTPIPVGAALWAEREIGVVTSAAVSPALGAVGLAYVKRGADPPLDAEARGEDGCMVVTVRALPLMP